MAILADPILLTIITLVAGWGISAVSKRAGLLISASGIIFLYVLSTPLVGRQLLVALESELYDLAAVAARPEAIVILGADLRRRTPEYGGDTVGRLSLERIRSGARLHRETGLPILAVGGAIADSEKPVAMVMAEALSADFQLSARWMETDSRNTYENAKLSSDILRAEGIQAVYLVTHAWHMPRALEAFRQVGITAIPRPTGWTNAGPGIAVSDFLPYSGALRNSAYAMHEWIGRLWYRIRYY